MIFFTVTNTRKKRSILIKAALILLMVAFLLPYLHGMMLEVSAMEDFSGTLTPEDTPVMEEAPPIVGQSAAGEENESAEGIAEEPYPGEPVRVDGELWLPLSYWQDIATILSF